jgi:hypothetical protein
LWVLVHGLPEDAATWRQDKSKWTNQDEWSAQILEGINGWGAVHSAQLAALGGQKVEPPEPHRIEHPDRPALPEPAKPEITKDPGEIARFFGLKERG